MDEDFSESEIMSQVSDGSENFNEIMENLRKDQKNKKETRSKIPPEIINQMGEANSYFFSNKLSDAVKTVHEIIRTNPNYSEPYHLLGMIHEEQDQKKKAAQYYMIAAQMVQKNSKLWEKIGNLYKDAGSYQHACYAFGRAYKSDKTRLSLLVDRAECFELQGDIKKAIKVFERLISLTSNLENHENVKKCAKLYAKIGQTSKSIEMLKSILRYPNSEELDYNVLNMICELHLKDSQNDVLVKYLEDLFHISDPESLDILQKQFADTPPDIITKYVIAKIKLGKLKEADWALELLMGDEAVENADFLRDIINCYKDRNNADRALKICERLQSIPELNTSNLWKSKGDYYMLLHNSESAIEAYKMAITLSEDNTDAKLRLSEIYWDQGEGDKAFNVLNLKKEFPGLPDDDEHRRSEPEEEIFLSDDENDKELRQDNIKQITGKKDQIPPFAQKKKINKGYERPVYDQILKKKIKIDPKTEIEISQKPTEDVGKGTKSINTGEKIQERLNELKIKYSIDDLTIAFKQAEISLKNKQHQLVIDIILKPLKQALELEVELQALEKKVLSRYLTQSQRKNFKKRMEYGAEIADDEDEDSGMLLKSSKKTKIKPQMLQKRKQKYSKVLTDRNFDNVSCMSKVYGKVDFYNLVEKIIRILEEHKYYLDLKEISEQLVKLRPQYLTKSNLAVNVFIIGFICNYQLEDYEKAFNYLKCCSKSFTQSEFFNTLLAVVLQKVEDPMVYRIYMSKLQVNELKSETKIQILANNYLQTGFYDLCMKTYYRLYCKDMTNPLYNLMLGIAFLHNSKSRTTANKPQSLKRAFFYFNQYFENRKNTHICESFYNLGRMYAQISYFKEAIKCFETVIDHHLERSLIQSRALEADHKCDSDNYLNQSVYNLIIIHKKLGNIELVKELMANYFTIKASS